MSKVLFLLLLCGLAGCKGSPAVAPILNGAFVQDKDSSATAEVVATGYEDSLEYVDYRISTADAGNKHASFLIPAFGAVVASPGQTINVSVYVTLRSGSVSYSELSVYEADVSGRFLGSTIDKITIANGALGGSLHPFSHAVADSKTTKVNGKLFIQILGPGEAVVRIHFNPTTAT